MRYIHKIWRDYTFSVVLLALFLVSLSLQTWMGWNEFVADQREHGRVAQWFGPSGYIWAWGAAHLSRTSLAVQTTVVPVRANQSTTEVASPRR